MLHVTVLHETGDHVDNAPVGPAPAHGALKRSFAQCLAAFGLLATLSEPLGVRAEWPAAPSEPLATSTPRVPTKPIGSELRVKFRADGPTWTARVFACERAKDDQNFAGEQGCAVLVLSNGCERRYMPIQDSFAVTAPRLVVLRNPNGRRGLLLTEASAVEQHADVWFVHVIEDDGQGPRLVFRTLFEACAWADDGAECTLARVKAQYVDPDGDGLQDIDFDFLGPNGLRHHDLFARQVDGRFALPARYTRADTYLHNFITDLSPPLGAVANAGSAPGGEDLECPWFVESPRQKVKVHESRGGRGPVIATLTHDARVDVVELRNGFARLGLPSLGWISANRIKQRCTK